MLLEKYKKDMNDAIKKYNDYKSRAEKNFIDILNGCKFGIPDPQDPFCSYFEYELICVVDEKNFLIKTRSFAVGKWHEEINDAGAYNIYA